MPCCTLIAFLLSQLGIAGSAIKVRLSGPADLVRLVPAPLQELFLRWRWAGLAAALSVELIFAGAAAPYVLTQNGRIAAAHSFASAWHICAVASRLSLVHATR